MVDPVVVGTGVGGAHRVKARDVVTNRILPRDFFKRPVTWGVTRRDQGVTWEIWKVETVQRESIRIKVEPIWSVPREGN